MKKAVALIMAGAMMLILAACGGDGGAGGSGGSMELKLGQVLDNPHGDRGFAVVSTVINGDTVVKAYIDEYQFIGGATGVPNSDADFAAGFADAANPLANKRVNNAQYSENMANNAGATMTLAEGYDAIQKYVEGKKISELEELTGKTDEEVVDAVAGTTLVDTKGYIGSIIKAAKAAEGTTAVKVDGSAADVKIGQVDGAAHGTRCFTVSTAVVVGDKVVLSWLDEFQFMDAEGATGVPNTDGNFGAGVAEGKVLLSKRVNNDLYSTAMAASGGATNTIAAGYDAVQAHANGKTIAEIKEAAGTGEAAVDAVAGSTLTDTANYLGAIAAAADAAK